LEGCGLIEMVLLLVLGAWFLVQIGSSSSLLGTSNEDGEVICRMGDVAFGAALGTTALRSPRKLVVEFGLRMASSKQCHRQWNVGG
jgi:hypothetical protein